jgi:gas vesicle protein
MTSGKVILSLLLAGAAIGAATVILFEPQKRKATRRFLSKKSEELTDELEETFSGIIDNISEKLESIREETIRIANNQKIISEEAEMDAAQSREKNSTGK